MQEEERYKEAYNALIKYLAAMQRSRKECKEKLYEKGFHRDEVEYALNKAEEHRYIDDVEYAADFVYFNRSRYGKKKIIYKLTEEKGVERRIAENAAEDGIDDEFEENLCRSFAEKFLNRKDREDKNLYAKTSAHLFQKGFDSSLISRVLSILFSESDLNSD